MRETAEDLTWLQGVLDASVERAGAFLRSSFEMPERSLSARQLVDRLAGMLTVALATVTARGEPRVAPIGAFLLRGRFCVPTVAEAARTRQLGQRPAASLTWFDGTSVAVICHGQVAIVDVDHPDFDRLDGLQVQLGGESAREWGSGVYLRLEPRTLFTYARTPGD